MSNLPVSCSNCGLADLCLPQALSDDDVSLIDDTVMKRELLRKGDCLFRAGDAFSAIYAVRSGSLKEWTLDEHGNEQVLAFYLPGEIIGFGAIESESYISTVDALETSSVCNLSYEELESLSLHIPMLQRQLFRRLSREIRVDQQLQLLLTKKSAEERVGAFIMNLSLRHQQRNLSGDEFRLSMTRADIGNYLGLAIETVSRAIAKLTQQHLVKVNNKDLQIVDYHGLCQLSHQTEA